MLSPTRCAAMDEQRVQAYLSLIQEFLAATGREDMQRLREQWRMVVN
ncbi:hypothetical protein [Arthrospira platensis]|nr:hypothetical protein [Arthrospira platensis]MDF2212538.1 hypothetical protein [Arthrospira platensis NCB002]MDT9181499.1 hypothetical protein [Limnospira sp. PMC 289.06]MDT9294072.1 hypothetical protein [Arthrospira platensis PCC 7345]MDT9309594.1 hypothetical protein [Limnospira sp. Paracas R14]QQW27439.1 hypothetical protein AP9108_19670 [Arthrospira sp. PCC 9108]